jgi:signal transduction histidine kinase/CheY-like chemotaxis protein
MSVSVFPERLGRSTIPPWVAIAVSLTLLLLSFALGVYNAVAARAETVRQATVQAEILASSLAAPLAFDDERASRDYVAALGADPTVEAVGAYDANGRLVASFLRAGKSPPAVNALGRPRISSGALSVAEPVGQGGLSLGSVYLRVDVEPLARRVARYLAVGSIIVMSCLLIAVLATSQARLSLANRKLREEMLERERAETALRQAQKMEAMGQLTGGVAHDFNNLLMVVSSGLELMERTEDPARRHRLKQGIRQAVDRGANLTQQLLAFARKAPLKTEVVDLPSELAGMHQVLDRSLREDISVQIVAERPVWPVEIDPAQFELAVLNIAINARDAMPRGGQITIRLANEGERVRVAIRDTGGGIAPEDLPRIFEPFFTTKEVGKGTGLGLSQVYGFARASGGEVQVESRVGAGTTVSLLLPRSLKALSAAAPRPAAATTTDARRRRVLLVEDDERVAELVSDMLEHLGCEIILTPNAAAALATARATPDLDVMITDMVMPGEMGGLELAQRMREERPDVAVILSTGYSASAAEAAAEGLRLLAKPYTIEALAAELESAQPGRPQAASPR